jgi:hypothetical protein
MTLGVSFHEWLTGSYWRLDAPMDERAIDLALEARAPDLGIAVRNRKWDLSGTLDAERLATHRAVEGSLATRVLDERRVLYRFSFAGDDGRRYELNGQKEWSSFMPFDSVTLLAASLYDGAGDEIGRATLRFDLRSDWARWVKNVRVHL